MENKDHAEDLQDLQGQTSKDPHQEKRDYIIKALRQMYPNGHPDFISMVFRELELHSDKNYDYAKGGDPLGNFRRVATILALYNPITLTPSAVALIFALKQLDAVFWGLSRGIQHKVEGIDSRLQDISIYSKLASILHAEDD